MHQYIEILKKNETRGEYSLEWCSKCGSLRLGPFSEPGAYNYFLFKSPNDGDNVLKDIENLECKGS